MSFRVTNAMMPHGTYDVEVFAVIKKAMKRSGETYPMVAMRVLHGQEGGKCVFVPIFAEMTYRFLKAIGEPNKNLTHLSPERWRGKRLTLTITHRVFEKYPRYDFYVLDENEEEKSWTK